MESLKTAMEQFAKYVSTTASVYAAVIVIFTYHVLLDKDLACTCKGLDSGCWVYMALPGIIILVLMLWMDKRFQRVCKFRCRYRKCNFFCVFLYHILRAVLVGLLWVASVLIDGDWYVCCLNDQDPQLACKDMTNITAEERGIINELINKSRVSFYLFISDIMAVSGN